MDYFISLKSINWFNHNFKHHNNTYSMKPGLTEVKLIFKLVQKNLSFYHGSINS